MSKSARVLAAVTLAAGLLALYQFIHAVTPARAPEAPRTAASPAADALEAAEDRIVEHLRRPTRTPAQAEEIVAVLEGLRGQRFQDLGDAYLEDVGN